MRDTLSAKHGIKAVCNDSLIRTPWVYCVEGELQENVHTLPVLFAKRKQPIARS